MMFKRQQPTETVKGHQLPPPRLTRAGYRALALYVVAPFLGALLLIDLALWCYFRFVLERCYGLWCLLS